MQEVTIYIIVLFLLIELIGIVTYILENKNKLKKKINNYIIRKEEKKNIYREYL